ncbi:uncharacterized protein LOC117181863 [Belonocnema kinseyi]|uniref:uncharacterized protein LOC117181863 n=1 Tax=Belonocnema kinseyi TaxID=2817044 RepID=UPI00143E075E|nr:uncharacterized protein LOC117181863 [Belonocnema kinseyi]XP_033230764.1 uncharacterized protein LOC117181863 [Belonocnema kinseyi]XP_033230765.1 uncharacterized protein LOC117181863 [Belonocnema kinseyi]
MDARPKRNPRRIYSLYSVPIEWLLILSAPCCQFENPPSIKACLDLRDRESKLSINFHSHASVQTLQIPLLSRLSSSEGKFSCQTSKLEGTDESVTGGSGNMIPKCSRFTSKNF